LVELRLVINTSNTAASRHPQLRIIKVPRALRCVGSLADLQM